MARMQRVMLRRRDTALAAIFLLSLGLGTAPGAWAVEVGRGVSLSSGVLFIAADDPEQIYGLIPTTGLGFTIPIDQRVDCFLRVSYMGDSGDPYYGRSDFSAPDGMHLKAVPVEWGLRVGTAGSTSRRLLVGLGAHCTWAEEDGPSTGFRAAEETKLSGFGWGLSLLAGPEFTFANDRLTAGMEWSLSFRSITLSNDSSNRTLDLSGMSMRGYLTANF